MPREVCYACIFCRSGSEREVAGLLAKLYPHLEATPLSQIKHRSAQGVKSTREQIVLPGYVFVKISGETSGPPDLRPIQDAFRMLRDSGGQWVLAGENARFAHWVFEQKGLIGLSVAHRVGDQVRVQSGPLKDLEGRILRIDRRSRNGQIEFRFDDRVFRIWLAFELVE